MVNQTMGEKEYLDDAISSQKLITSSYNTYANECCNNQLRADFILNVLTQGVFVRVAVLPLVDAERPQRSFRVFQHLKQIGQVTELCISDLHFLSSFPVFPRRICKKSHVRVTNMNIYKIIRFFACLFKGKRV